MSCGYSEERLALYMDSADSKFSAEEVHDMDRHLASCTSCREVLAKLCENQLLIGSLHADAVNSSVLSNVHQRVMDQVAGLERSPAWVIQLERYLFSGLRRKYALAGFGSLVLVCCLTLGIVWQARKSPANTVAQTPVVNASRIASSPQPIPASSPIGNTPHAATSRPSKRVAKIVSVAASTADIPQHTMVKLFTDDPNVVIYWSLDGNGETR